MALSRSREIPVSFPWLPRNLDWRFILPRALLIVGLIFLIYGPCLRGGFIWDDLPDIVKNRALHAPDSLWKFWFQPGSWREYYPVEETVLWSEWRLWGYYTLGYHLINVSLHALSALLVWRLLAKFGLRFAWWGGLLFAVHPNQVISVAWITELKNALSLPPFLLALCAWIDFQDRGRKADYAWTLGLFLVAMLCKVSVAMFPVVILLYAWWKRGAITRRDFVGSAPFFAISLLLGWAAIKTQEIYAASNYIPPLILPAENIISRLALAGWSIAFYLAKGFLPIDQRPAYPLWPIAPPTLAQFVPWLVMGAVLCVLWLKRRTWGRHALLGLGFFLIIIAPAPGILARPANSFGWVMEQLSYVSLIGIIGLAIAASGDLKEKLPLWVGRSAAAGGVLVLILFGVSAHAFAGWFVDDEFFWRKALQRDPASWVARNSLAHDLNDQKRYPEAIRQLQQAIAVRPEDSDDFCCLGVALDKLGQTGAAIAQYRHGLALDPRNSVICLNLGEMLVAGGQNAEGEALFRQGLQAQPLDDYLHNNLASVLVRTGRAAEAVGIYRQLISKTPDVSVLHYNLGNALSASGDTAGAMTELQTAVSLDPSVPGPHENLGTLFARLGRLPEAIIQLAAAVRIDPQMGVGHDNLALALAQTGDMNGARAQFEWALKLNPQDSDARAYLLKIQQYESRKDAPKNK